MEKLRVFEAFAGYGSQSLALKYLNVNFEAVGASEIEPNACLVYEALHKGVKNYGDITKLEVDDLPDHDLFTYSFPCQDISMAGLKKGFIEGSGTRSSLLWECKKVIEGKKPKYLLMENVAALLREIYKYDFFKWGDWLQSQGYTNYYKIVNAKDYGIPQTRSRVLMVSILEPKNNFIFPASFDSGLRIKHFIESIDEEARVQEDVMRIAVGRRRVLLPESRDFLASYSMGSLEANNYGYRDISPCLIASNYKRKNLISMPIVERQSDVICVDSRWDYLYTQHGLSQGLYDYEGAEDIRNICLQEYIKNGYTDCKVHMMSDGLKDAKKLHISRDYKIRSMTPRESFRLMGVHKEDVAKILEMGLSDTALYHLAGNSIVVDVLMYVFATMLRDEDCFKGH